MLNLKGPSVGISGRFKIDVLNSKGELVEDKCLPEQKNLVTETGLSHMLSGANRTLRLVLGTGSTPPQREDNRLDNTLVVSPNSIGFQGPAGATLLSDRSYEISKEFVFNLGQVVGNITELGLASTYTNISTYSLVTRALIKDALGNATSIEILEDEQIKITYTLKAEIAESGEPYTISVEKDGDLEEHIIIPIFKIKHAISPLGFFNSITSTANSYIGLVVDSTGSANSFFGNSLALNSATFSEDRRTYTKEYKAFAGINNWNGEVRWAGIFDYIANYFSGGFQVNNNNGIPTSGTSFIWQIDPPITKTDEQVMEITCSVSVTYGD